MNPTIWNNPALLSAFGSAMGGFIAVLLFFVVRLGIAFYRFRPKHITTYKIANYLNRGQKGEMAGEIQHNMGRIVSETKEIKKISARGEVWEYTRDYINNPGGSVIFYGPYSTDCSEPGLYSATFRLRAIGLPSKEELHQDYILLELDVSNKNVKYVSTEKNVVAFKADSQISRKFVRVSDLANKGWVEIVQKFFSAGTGEWEYRAWAYNGQDSRPDNIAKCGNDFRIFFDHVKIIKCNKFEIPPA